MKHTFIIAELATTWVRETEDKSVRALSRTIQQCASNGADAVKLQWCGRPGEMAARRKMPQETYRYLDFPFEILEGASAQCRALNIAFMCTVFIPRDVALVAPLVGRYKVASLEALSYDLKDAYSILPRDKPLYVSTGAMTEQQVLMCREHWRSYWNAQLLHCTAIYPQPVSTLNIAAIQNYDFIGLSDHTRSVSSGAIAVVAGAEVLEKHVRADECPMNNPDCLHSLPLGLFYEYVEAVRIAEQALGGSDKRLYPDEEQLACHRVTA